MISSGPGRALACWIAARSVHWFASVAHAGLPVSASGSSAGLSTVNGPAPPPVARELHTTSGARMPTIVRPRLTSRARLKPGQLESGLGAERLLRWHDLAVSLVPGVVAVVRGVRP